VEIDADFGWAHADGPVTLDIPKSELLDMGADPTVWE
jgi:hypothetical protein